MALAAMRFEQAQRKALTAKAGKTPGKPTPTRVAPGPASTAPSQARAGNRTHCMVVRKWLSLAAFHRLVVVTPAHFGAMLTQAGIDSFRWLGD
jgi:hypothetical protein